jgi:hypothetical protein
MFIVLGFPGLIETAEANFSECRMKYLSEFEMQNGFNLGIMIIWEIF